MNHAADHAYYVDIDARQLDDAHIDECATAIYNELTVTGADVDAEESATMRLSWDALREAYILMQTGARDAALTAFADEFCRVANLVAEELAVDRMEYERKEAEIEAAVRSAEYMEDR